MDHTLGQSFAAFVSAGIGAALAVSIGVSHRQLCALISFAAGTLLSASVFHILPEASSAGISAPSLFIAIATGYGLFFLISKYVFHMCPACAASHFEEQQVSKFKNVFFLIAIALTIHSAMDGIAIAMSPHMADHAHTDHSTFFTIAIHKLPEGLALCALLLKSGHEKMRALIWTLVFETSTLLGWAIGYFLLKGQFDEMWLNLLMVHIAGGFIYLAVHATINEIRDHSPKIILTFFLLGFIFMAFVR